MKVQASKFASASLPNNKYKNRLVNILPCKLLSSLHFHLENASFNRLFIAELFVETTGEILMFMIPFNC